MRDRRATSFLLEPARYRTDPAVLSMSLAARGAYSILFMAGWDMPEPGVYPADDRVLASLAMTTPDEWAAVKVEVARAFDTESRPGWWVQKGLRQTKHAQDRFLSFQSKRGRAGAKARWDKVKDAKAMRKHHENHAGPMAYRGRGSVLGSDESTSTPLPHADASGDMFGSPSAPNGKANGPPHDPDDLTPEQWFDECFWPTYPRKAHTSKTKARQALVAVFKRTPKAEHDALAADISRGLARYCEHVAGKDAEFVLHAASFIAQRRWETAT